MEQDSVISFPRFPFTWGLEPGLSCGWNEFFTMWKSCCPSHGVFLPLYNHASLGLGQREDCLGIVGNDWSYPCLPTLMPFLFPQSSWLPHFAWWSSIYLRTRERRGKRVKNPFKELWHLFLSFREIKEKRHNSGAAAFLSWHTSKTLYRRGSFFSYKTQLQTGAKNKTKKLSEQLKLQEVLICADDTRKVMPRAVTPEVPRLLTEHDPYCLFPPQL